MSDVAWHSVPLAPLVLIKGGEGLIAQRALERLRTLADERDPATVVHDLSGEALTAGALRHATSPSLFGEPRLVIIPDFQSAPEGLVEEVRSYTGAPEPDVSLVVVHRSGNRGKKALDALKKAGAAVVAADPLKRASEKQAFVAAEFTRAGRSIRSDAVSALVDAFGTDLSELAAISRQIIADTTPEDGQAPPTVTVEQVRDLTAGRVETTAFAVADALIAGREAQALQLVQQAQLAGADAIPIIAAIALKLRQLARAAAPGASARSAGVPDWVFRGLSREARGWSDRALARAFEAVARADHEAKGAGRDPAWSLQRMIMDISRARRAG